MQGQGFARNLAVRLIMCTVALGLATASAAHYTGTYGDGSGTTLVVSHGQDGVLAGELAANGVVYRVEGFASGDTPGKGTIVDATSAFVFTSTLSPDATTLSLEVRAVDAQGQPTAAAPFTLRLTRTSNAGLAPVAPSGPAMPPAAPNPLVPATPPPGQNPLVPATPPAARNPLAPATPASPVVVAPAAPPRLPPPGAGVGAVAGAELIYGTLAPGAATLQTGEFLEIHDRSFPVGRAVELRLLSQAFDPYLAVIDPAGTVLFEVASADGMSVGQTFTPASDGVFQVLVTTVRPGEVGPYELTIAVAGTVGGAPPVVPVVPSTPVPSVGVASSVAVDAATAGRAQDPAQGMVGAIPVGSPVNGRLGGSAEVTYHTYRVDLPAGASDVSFRLTADADLDLFVKPGAEIADWGDQGDWLQRDITTEPSATLMVGAPVPGPWYVDIVFAQGGAAVASYTFEVQVP